MVSRLRTRRVIVDTCLYLLQRCIFIVLLWLAFDLLTAGELRAPLLSAYARTDLLRLHVHACIRITCVSRPYFKRICAAHAA